MKELIETREDVIANIKTLYSYLNNESDIDSYEWAIERLSKGKNYVVEIIDSHICFAPSRFVGYKKNTKKKHSGENQGDGKETDPQLKKLYKIVQDGRLDELFQLEIRQYGLSSGSKKYFISKDMTVDEILKYANNPSADKYVSLLKSNHNLILTGAPGTGKTYLAKQIAQAMGCTDNEIGFVQFHPSYDYTDFVEGLRPLDDDGGNVGFERKDGVFKEFCAKALENLTDSQKSLQTLQQETSVRDLIDDFVQDAIDSDLKLETQGTKNVFHIIENKAKHITIDIPKNEKTRVIALPKSDLITLLENKVDISGSKDIQLYFQRKYRTQQDSYTYVLYEKLKSLESKTKVETVSLIPKKNFVFIIDEINRGEINRIFGELFFSIDPSYRGEKGRVQTQYQNMVEDGDAFKKGFFVPENVYIIGTMNDIDRSVESMDFAFRRRFAFKEVTAKETQTMLDSDDAWKDETGVSQKPENNVIDEIKARMNSLNAAIENTEGLSSAYHIGASYFLKLANYKNNGSYDEKSFEQLWKYHLKGLLFEYLRGTPNAVTDMEKLEAAYFKPIEEKQNGSTSDNGQPTGE